MLPSKFAPKQVTIADPAGAARLYGSVLASQDRAILIVNRGTYRVRIGADVGVADQSVGFMLRPGEGILLATAAEIWGSNGTYHLSQVAL